MNLSGWINAVVISTDRTRFVVAIRSNKTASRFGAPKHAGDFRALPRAFVDFQTGDEIQVRLRQPSWHERDQAKSEARKARVEKREPPLSDPTVAIVRRANDPEDWSVGVILAGALMPVETPCALIDLQPNALTPGHIVAWRRGPGGELIIAG